MILKLSYIFYQGDYISTFFIELYNLFNMLIANNICAPRRYDITNDTCFTIDKLIEIAKAYNRYITINVLTPNTRET